MWSEGASRQLGEENAFSTHNSIYVPSCGYFLYKGFPFLAKHALFQGTLLHVSGLRSSIFPFTSEAGSRHHHHQEEAGSVTTTKKLQRTQCRSGLPSEKTYASTLTRKFVKRHDDDNTIPSESFLTCVQAFSLLTSKNRHFERHCPSTIFSIFSSQTVLMV